MSLKLYFNLFALIAIGFAEKTDPICSVPNEQEGKQCISIKFPWKKENVFFCTEDQFDYKPCNMSAEECWKPPADHLYFAMSAPWTCCPQIIETDYCKNSPCLELPPYNRTCTTTSPSANYGTCCDQYYCGDSGNYSTCDYTACPQAPENATFLPGSYIGDVYGCCTYYELQGESKPGYCPAIKDENISNEESSYNWNSTFRYCIGDYTCPEEQKCCLDQFRYQYTCQDPDKVNEI